MIFDISPSDPAYPEALRQARQALQMTQAEFGLAAGHSGVMQGRYETARGKNSSAIPSEKTAEEIKAMIAARSAPDGAGAATTVGRSYAASGNGMARPPVRSFKTVTVQQIEEAIAMALRTLIDGVSEVNIKDLVLESHPVPGSHSEATITLVVVSNKVEGGKTFF